MSFRDDINAFLAHPLVDTYLYLCLWTMIGAILISLGSAAFACIRVWMGLPPMPADPSSVNETQSFAGGVFFTIAVLLTIRRWQRRKANRRGPLQRAGSYLPE